MGNLGWITNSPEFWKNGPNGHLLIHWSLPAAEMFRATIDLAVLRPPGWADLPDARGVAEASGTIPAPGIFTHARVPAGRFPDALHYA